MKIALVCPSNIVHMPYLENYIKLLNKISNVDFVIINWDRFHIEQDSDFCFKDKKHGHPRNFFDYAKYASFVKGKLNGGDFDRIVVFGLQLMFFLSGFLVRNYKGRYIFDVRDFNAIKRISDFKKAISHSAFTVISSPGYKGWLPDLDKYVVNHNLNIEGFDCLGDVSPIATDDIEISCIGALKDIAINIKLIEALECEKNIRLSYRGEGVINADLQNYVDKNNISRVEISGRYDSRLDEARLYGSADIINMIMTPGSINNDTCLSNRLYNAAIFGRPLIALRGSLIASLIERYKLGIVVSTVDELREEIHRYASLYDPVDFDLARRRFLQDVMNENEHFKNKIQSFVL